MMRGIDRFTRRRSLALIATTRKGRARNIPGSRVRNPQYIARSLNMFANRNEPTFAAKWFDCRFVLIHSWRDACGYVGGSHGQRHVLHHYVRLRISQFQKRDMPSRCTVVTETDSRWLVTFKGCCMIEEGKGAIITAQKEGVLPTAGIAAMSRDENFPVEFFAPSCKVGLEAMDFDGAATFHAGEGE